MSEDINETPAASPNFKTELAKQLEELVPEAIEDGKVNVDKLKELLDGDAADESERFGLFWPGKLNAIRAAQTPTTATLKPAPELSKDWDDTQNVFIEGDNLEALKILQKHYHGKIKMIYIDPPYNTGKDFVYPDNYKEGLQAYLEWTRQVNEEGKKVSSNSESDGRYHSHWLNMMYPRLKLARGLLGDDGLIFISIDDNEIDNLKKLCNELFGENNFVNTIIWHYGKMSNEKNKLPNNHEYILVYKKTASAGIFTKVKKEDSEYRNRYLRFVTPENTVVYGSVKNSSDRLIALRVKKIKEVLNKPALSDSDILFDFNQEFKSHSDTIYVSTIKGNSSENISVFDTGQKPLALMNLLLQFGSPNKDDIVLDFFSGSGTTAEAVMRLNTEDGGNRHHIQVQLPEPVGPSSAAGKAGFKTIADISRKRIDLAGEKIKRDYAEQLAKRDTPLDVGYRTYRLTDTNFAKWRETSDTDATTLEQHLLDLRENADDDADQLALLTEILLKQGYSLTEKVEPITVEGLDVLSVADGLALAYVNEQVKPTLGQLRALVDREPERLIILEDAFHGDDQLKTNLVQLAKTKHVNLWTA